MSDETDVFDVVPCGVVRMSADGAVLAANARFRRSAAREAAELEGVAFPELLTPGARIFFETRVMAVLQLGGEVTEVSLDLRRPDGSEHPVLVNARLAGDEVVLALFDAIERHDYERDLLAATRSAEQSELRLRILQASTGLLAACSTAAELLVTVESIFRDAFRATGVVALFDLGGEFVDGAELAGEPGRRVAVSREIVDRIGSGTRVIPRDQAPDSVLGLFDHGDRMQTLTTTPVVEDGVPVGVVLCAYARHRDLTVEAALVHDALARQLALTLSRLRLQGQLERLAREDPLTSLANRTELRERLAARQRDRDDTLALVFLDLDRFKQINDELGHAAGDAVLVEVASRLHATVRAHDVTGRFGGDEFVVLCEGLDGSTARELGERLAAAVAEPIPAIGGRRVLASVGIAVVSAASAVASDTLLRAADEAMYRSKNTGGGTVTVVEI